MLHKRKAVTMTRVSTRCLHGALGLEIRQYTKGCRPGEGQPVQTVSLHLSLTALFNELAAAKCIPRLVCTGPSG